MLNSTARLLIWQWTAPHTLRAMGLTDELLGAFKSQLESVELLPSDGGRFEVTVDGELVYSKLATRGAGRDQTPDPGKTIKRLSRMRKAKPQLAHQRELRL